MLPNLNDIFSGLSFFFALPKLLRYRVDAQAARAALTHRLENREGHFLSLAKSAIYDCPTSPYLKLLRLAGCEYGDLESSVRGNGVEATLRALYREGVYLTAAEAKGRQPVVRGGAAFLLTPKDLAKPGVRGSLVGESGGSRGARTPVPIDLDLEPVRATEMILDIEARGGKDWTRAIWAVPGAVSLRRVISYTLCGSAPERWFSVVDTRAAGLHPRYRWSARALRIGALIAGVDLPSLVYVPLQNPLPIARWAAQMLAAGRTPQIYTYPSCAVRLCEAAHEHAISLAGCQFIIGGEPTTRARLAVIESAGATAQPQYGSVETGTLGRGCMDRERPDDLHLMHDKFAVVQPEEHASALLPPQAFLITSLYLPLAQQLLFNVSLGDQGIIEHRPCGCPLYRLGWTTHLHTIRSFEKLTAGGMTLTDADLAPILEELLPARFGGGPTDYQLIDGETDRGRPLVRLLVHPRLGPLDHAAVRQTFLEAIGTGSGVERVAMSVWLDAGLPIVERGAPQITASGKIQHVHLDSGSHRPRPGTKSF